jgi:hypothetical protein
MLENEYYKISIEEIEKYIIMKKIENMSLEEIKNWIESQSQIIIIKDCIIEKKDKEIKKLNDIIQKAKNYIDKYLKEHIIEDQPDEQSIFYDEKGYYIPNAKEQLLNILNDKDN